MLVVPRFFEVVVDADFVDGADGVLFISETREQDPRGVGLQAARHREEIDTVHLRHQEVGDDEVDRVALQLGDCRGGIVVDAHRVIGLEFEQTLKRAENQLIVIDGQDTGRG